MGRTFAFALAVGLVGCSSSSANADGLNIDASVLKSQASALSTTATAAGSDDAAAIATNLATVANTAAALIPGTRGNASRAHLKSALGASSCACPTATDKTCTFAGCRIGSVVASGTVSWADGDLKCTGLTFDVDAIGKTQIEGSTVTIGATHIGVTCDVAYGSDYLAGTLGVTGGTSVDEVAYSWDATVSAKDVTFTSRAITGGTVGLKGTLTSVSDADGTHSTPVTGSATFP